MAVMKPKRWLVGWVAVGTGLITGLIGCGTSSGPAEIHWGAETCDFCRMLITDPTFAGQYRLDDGTVRKFDDVVCLLRSYRREAARVLQAWVMDETGHWIPVQEAWYLASERWRGPMGGPWRAFRTVPSDIPGRPIRWSDLVRGEEERGDKKPGGADRPATPVPLAALRLDLLRPFPSLFPTALLPHCLFLAPSPPALRSPCPAFKS